MKRLASSHRLKYLHEGEEGGSISEHDAVWASTLRAYGCSGVGCRYLIATVKNIDPVEIPEQNDSALL